jgi:hypothetical protein
MIQVNIRCIKILYLDGCSSVNIGTAINMLHTVNDLETPDRPQLPTGPDDRPRPGRPDIPRPETPGVIRP